MFLISTDKGVETDKIAMEADTLIPKKTLSKHNAENQQIKMDSERDVDTSNVCLHQHNVILLLQL